EGVILRGADKFYPGTGCSIDVRAYLNCSGGSWNNYSGYIRTGDNCEIGPYNILWGAGGITLGNNVHLGAHVHITAHESIVPREGDDVFKPLGMKFSPVVVEDHVLISSGTIITPGVRIGHHTQIGAGAVVTSNIPPYSIAVGSPARVIRTLAQDENLSVEVMNYEGGPATTPI
ncbi:MAG: acyltransferase, partial [Candidatus Eremiobacteraeota bacterium]|nr:acyltransferase [Candidatus Eremiobacteraeota bacterium]